MVSWGVVVGSWFEFGVGTLSCRFSVHLICHSRISCVQVKQQYRRKLFQNHPDMRNNPHNREHALSRSISQLETAAGLPAQDDALMGIDDLGHGVDALDTERQGVNVNFSDVGTDVDADDTSSAGGSESDSDQLAFNEDRPRAAVLAGQAQPQPQSQSQSRARKGSAPFVPQDIETIKNSYNDLLALVRNNVAASAAAETHEDASGTSQ